MFKKIVKTATVLGLSLCLLSVANGQEPTEPGKKPPEKTIMPAMKSLLDDGNTVEKDDYILLTRPVGAWVLKCDLDLAHDKRVCWIQQSLKMGDKDLTITFQNTKTGAAFFTVKTNAKIDAANGLHMGFSGLEKVLRNGVDIECNDSGECQGGFEFSGIVGAAIMSAAELKFFYLDTANGEQTVRTGQITMAGVKQAMELAASNPYAAIEKKKLVIQEKEAKKTADKVEAKKPKKTPVKQRENRTGNRSSLY